MDRDLGASAGVSALGPAAFASAAALGRLAGRAWSPGSATAR